MKTMLLMTSETLGRGDDDLGRRLTVKFLHQVTSAVDKPHVIAFYNGGVRLLASASPVLDALKALDEAGVDLVACGTCVDHFALRDRIAVGRMSDMREIVSAVLAAEKVITV